MLAKQQMVAAELQRRAAAPQSVPPAPTQQPRTAGNPGGQNRPLAQ
jgi:hypothetical protein